ncbi:MAG: divergent polysaccharide deacetylase family protein, partial [Rhodospirillaceae bacterium]
RLAHQQGVAIGIGHPRPATLAALGPWLASLPEKGIRLVPLSALALQRPIIAAQR